MPGLSLLFLLSQLITMVLFYPITITYLVLYRQRTDSSKSTDDLYLEKEILPQGGVFHILLVVVFTIVWLLSLCVQVVNILFTTELSTQRLVTWSAVQPYARIGMFLIKFLQALFLTCLVRHT